MFILGFVGKVYDGSLGQGSTVYLLKLIYYIFIFLLILIASYYITRYVSKKSIGKNKFIRLIETFSLGRDKSLHLIKIGEELFLISSTLKGINLISRFSKEEYNSFMAFQNDSETNEELDMNMYNQKYDLDIKGFESNLTRFKKFFKGNKEDD